MRFHNAPKSKMAEPDEGLVKDVATAKSLLTSFTTQIDEITNSIQHLDGRVKKKELSTAKGVSFLEVKIHLLLSYLMNLCHVMSNKLHGSQISRKSVERLVEIRTVLEKMRPIDQKLKYQIDKLLKTAATGAVAENDPLRLKPNPKNLESKVDDDSNEESDEGDEEHGGFRDASDKKYRPPKLSAVQYTADETVKEREEKLIEKKKKRALSSSIMRDLKAEHYDGPTEIQESANLHRAKIDKAGREREEYEEKYFMRMQVSKKEQNAAKRLRTMGDLNSITHFGNINALTGGDGDDDGMPRKKRKSTGGKKKKKGGAKKRKFKH